MAIDLDCRMYCTEMERKPVRCKIYQEDKIVNKNFDSVYLISGNVIKKPPIESTIGRYSQIFGFGLYCFEVESGTEAELRCWDNAKDMHKRADDYLPEKILNYYE